MRVANETIGALSQWNVEALLLQTRVVGAHVAVVAVVVVHALDAATVAVAKFWLCVCLVFLVVDTRITFGDTRVFASEVRARVGRAIVGVIAFDVCFTFVKFSRGARFSARAGLAGCTSVAINAGIAKQGW